VAADFNGPGVVWQTRLDSSPVLVAAGKISGDNIEIAVAMGKTVSIYTPEDSVYRILATAEAEREVLSLAVGLPVTGRDSIILGSEDRITLWGFRQGSLQLLGRTDPEPGARFTDLAVGDLDGDGRQEIAGAASGTENIYVYRLAGQEDSLRLELAGIRLVPGRPVQVEIFRSSGGPGIAVLYWDGDISGLVIYFLTEEGFAEGPALENLPGRPMLLVAGNFTEGLALGGGDGRVRIIAVTGSELKTILTTSVLGSAVSALASVSRGFSLAAGTPGGYVFIFGFPVQQEPDRAVHNGEPVYSLADAGSGRLALGTVRGVLQLISVDNVAAGVAYTVRPGDTLWLIAGRFATTAVKIMQENNIREPGLIYPGQVLTIPPS